MISFHLNSKKFKNIFFSIILDKKIKSVKKSTNLFIFTYLSFKNFNFVIFVTIADELYKFIQIHTN